MFKGTSLLRLFAALLTCLPLVGVSWAAHINTSTHSSAKSKKISETQHTRRRLHHLAHSRSASVTPVSVSTRRHRYHERFHMS
jgi:hypothetical protein